MGIVGKLLGGRYKVTDTLSSGGMGETYTARDTHRPKQPICVVKRLKPLDLKLLSTARKLFNREAETLERLGNHDQIPRLLAYFEENKEFFLVQELIEGEPLNVELPLGHRWTDAKVIQLLKDVLTVLDFVHTEGVIHRDIKPANLIRRNQDRRLVLIDFGAVKEIRYESSPSGHSRLNLPTSIGTDGYMPPEQQQGSPDLSSDIYALGMIGIQALTGINPAEFRRDRNKEVLWQHEARVSQELANILGDMVRYYFRDRYQSATEALQALQQYSNQNEAESTLAPQEDRSSAVSKIVLQETKVAPSSEPLASDSEPLALEPVLEIEQASEINPIYAPPPEQSPPEVELQDTSAEQFNPESSDEIEPEFSLDAVDLSSEPMRSETASTSERQETKVALEHSAPFAKAPSVEQIAEKDELSQKVSLPPERSPVQEIPVPTLQETKISGLPQQAPPSIPLPETKVSLKTEQARSTPNLQETRFASDFAPKPLLETKVSLGSSQVNQTPDLPETRFSFSPDAPEPIQPIARTPKRHLKAVAIGLGSVVAVGAIAIAIAVMMKPPETVKPPLSSKPTLSIDVDTPKPSAVESPSPRLAGDYTKLREYLQQQPPDWEAADRETFELMLKLAGENSVEQGRFVPEDWYNFHRCEDVKEIDHLWREASNNKLGFSVQNKIYEAEKENINAFRIKVGWLETTGTSRKVDWKYKPEARKTEYLPGKQPDFETPPKGSLPAMLEWEPIEGMTGDLRFIMCKP
jgi:serine/threonine protein kinase